MLGPVDILLLAWRAPSMPIELSVEEPLLGVLSLCQKSEKHGQPTFLSKAACSA